MDAKIIQKRVNDLAAAMVAKGMREPDARMSISANAEPYVYLTWRAGLGSRLDAHKNEFFRASFAEALDKAATFIAKQPDAEQAKLNDFMSALGSVIDIGKQNNIEDKFLSPLVVAMKTLSENVITDQRAA